jgi:hypothetical protein
MVLPSIFGWIVVDLYLEELKFCVIHPSILGTYFPFPEVKLRGKM